MKSKYYHARCLPEQVLVELDVVHGFSPSPTFQDVRRVERPISRKRHHERPVNTTKARWGARQHAASNRWKFLWPHSAGVVYHLRVTTLFSRQCIKFPTRPVGPNLCLYWSRPYLPKTPGQTHRSCDYPRRSYHGDYEGNNVSSKKHRTVPALCSACTKHFTLTVFPDAGRRRLPLPRHLPRRAAFASCVLDLPCPQVRQAPFRYHPGCATRRVQEKAGKSGTHICRNKLAETQPRQA